MLPSTIVCLLIAAGLSGYLAKSRGRSFVVWFVMGLLMSPVISIVALLLIEDRAAPASAPTALTSPFASAPTAHPPAPQPAALPPHLVGTELERLSALVDKGRLTEAEYNEQKARILGAKPPEPTPEPPKPSPPAVPPEDREATLAALRTQLSTPKACVELLTQRGCKVTQTKPEEWAVLKPTGVTAYARSPEALRDLAVSFAEAA